MIPLLRRFASSMAMLLMSSFLLVRARSPNTVDDFDAMNDDIVHRIGPTRSVAEAIVDPRLKGIFDSEDQSLYWDVLGRQDMPWIRYVGFKFFSTPRPGRRNGPTPRRASPRPRIL